MNLVYVIGMGPGSSEGMTYEAKTAIEDSQVIVGYTKYIELIKDIYPDKEMISTAMKQEIERCRLAFDKSMEHKTVAMVCSGDAGVYGMAGLMIEIGREYPQCKVKVIAGVTAALSGAALLGAPLMHDFAIISLSDLMTPWDKIEKRLRLASEADFVICLYNPGSKKRADYLEKACDIMSEHKSPETVCAVTVNIGRDGEECKIMSLSKLREYKADMFTTVYVGNSQTVEIDSHMVTPRGYENKSQYQKV